MILNCLACHYYEECDDTELQDCRLEKERKAEKIRQMSAPVVGSNGLNYDIVYSRVFKIARRLNIGYLKGLELFGKRIERKLLMQVQRKEVRAYEKL